VRTFGIFLIVLADAHDQREFFPALIADVLVCRHVSSFPPFLPGAGMPKARQRRECSISQCFSPDVTDPAPGPDAADAWGSFLNCEIFTETMWFEYVTQPGRISNAKSGSCGGIPCPFRIPRLPFVFLQNPFPDLGCRKNQEADRAGDVTTRRADCGARRIDP